MSVGRRTTSFSKIKRAETPERRERIDAIKRAMDDVISLSELRAIKGLTQVELASRLKVSQGNVSELERRDDVYFSTLREYVEAVGGHLELTAVFAEDERFQIYLAKGGAKGAPVRRQVTGWIRGPEAAKPMRPESAAKSAVRPESAAK